MKNLVKQLFVPPKLMKGHPQLHSSFASIDGSAEEEARRNNEVEISIANFEVQKEALQESLRLTHASFITSIFASLVAVAAVIVAIFHP
jgi:hypothetical protein